MSTYYIDGLPPTIQGNPPTSFSIGSWLEQQPQPHPAPPPLNIIVDLFGDPTFMDMNAWDCCKDAGPHDAGADKMNQFLPNLFPIAPGGALWTHNWHTNLENNFKTYITNNNIKEEEIVFERNKIEVTKLDQYFFSNESGLGGSRVAFDKTKIFEIDTGAQHVDEGPGTGNPNYSFPKPGDTLIFRKSFFEFLGFPNIISQWECTTTDNGIYTYKITLMDGTTTIPIIDPNVIRVSNPNKNTRISSDTCSPISCVVLILLKELGDVMQTATYLVFIKLAEELQRRLGPDVVGATIPVQLTQQQKQEAPSLLPINLDANFSQCLLSKNINYSAIMLTCDNTVHNRNIKLGIPSCVTCSYKEVPYPHATQAGRIYLPITDRVEKLKSLLEMEYKIIEKNNTTIKQRLIMSHSHNAKKLIYQKLGMGGANKVENTVPSKFNTDLIIAYIDRLTTEAQQMKVVINQYITTKAADLKTNQTLYARFRDKILGITDDQPLIPEIGSHKFKDRLCPPFVIPVPPRIDQTSGIKRTNRTLYKLSVDIFKVPPGNNHQELYNLIIANLRTAGALQPNDDAAKIVGGHSKQRGGGKVKLNIPADTKPNVNSSITKGTDKGTNKKKVQDMLRRAIGTIDIVLEFSRSEKFLIYCLSGLEYNWEDTFIFYTYCIYMLEYYKNVPIKISGKSFGISDPEYAYYRLYRVLNDIVNIFKIVLGKSEIPLQVIKAISDKAIKVIEVIIKFGIDGRSAKISAELDRIFTRDNLKRGIAATLEEFIDDYINKDLLHYFLEHLAYIDKCDDFEKYDGKKYDDSQIDDNCMHVSDIVTGDKIQIRAIRHNKSNECIDPLSIIRSLNAQYPGKPISNMPDEFFINPYTMMPYSWDIIDLIIKLANPNVGMTTRSGSGTILPILFRGGKYSYLSKQFTTNKNKMHNKKLATKTRKHKSQKQKNQRKHKSIKYKSQKQKNRRKHKSRKHKPRMPKQDKAL